MKYSCLTIAVFAAAAMTLSGADRIQIPDQEICKAMEHSEIKLPPRLYTPELLELLVKEKKNPLNLCVANGARFVMGKISGKIKPEDWKDIIPDCGAFSIRANTSKCPFCGKNYSAPNFTVDDYINNPHQFKLKCCGAIVYERESDMPADYPMRPNHTLKIPHMDGTIHEYRFHIPENSTERQKKSPIALKGWYCPAAEVQVARLTSLHYGKEAIMPALACSAFRDHNKLALTHLAAIYDRLAEIYPGLPIAGNADIQNCIAYGSGRGVNRGYLTAAEYRATEVPRSYMKPKWFRGYNMHKLGGRPAWQDGVMLEQAELMDIFDYIHDKPEIKEYSRKKYGNPDAWEKKVRKGVIEEAYFIAQWSPVALQGGNTSMSWVDGALKVGIVTQDTFFIRAAADLIERMVANQYYSDGLCTEGCFGYSGLLNASTSKIPVLKKYFGIDMEKQFPYIKRFQELMNMPVKTLYGIESMHGDEFVTGFMGMRYNWNGKPQEIDYVKNMKAQNFPESGLSVLRTGKPGSRLEVMIDYQKASGHTHLARQNVQVFYEGVPTMPDLGYTICMAAPQDKRWYSQPYPFPKLPAAETHNGLWGAWYGMGVISESHNIPLIDGLNTLYPYYGPSVFRRYCGVNSVDDPTVLAQFVEVDSDRMMNIQFPEKKIDLVNRQIVPVTCAGGRSLMIDIVRLRGGKHHAVNWHIPSTGMDGKPVSTLADAKPMKTATYLDYMLAGKFRDVKKDDKLLCHIRKLTERPMQDHSWNLLYHVDPEVYEPKTDGGKELYAPWKKIMHPVDLSFFGTVNGSKADSEFVMEMRCPWPIRYREVFKKGKPESATIALQDALHLFQPIRKSEQQGLYSVFSTVLEPRTPDQEKLVKSMTELKGESGSEQTASGTKLELSNGSTLYAATALNTDGMFKSGDFSMKARMGVAIPEEYSMRIYDGSEISCGKFSAAVPSTVSMKLINVSGDLTGKPEESALFVESPAALPCDNTLIGQTITVQHQISRNHTTGYNISKVTDLGNHQYRIDLENAPQFIINRMKVQEVLDKAVQQFRSDFMFMKGQNTNGIYNGYRIHFPKTGFDSSMKLCPTRNWFAFKFTVDDKFPEGQYPAVGDPFLIYQIQKGDTVILPSNFAIVGKKSEKELKLNISSVTGSRITIPGKWKTASLMKDGKESPLSVSSADEKITFEIAVNDLKDGKGTVILR